MNKQGLKNDFYHSLRKNNNRYYKGNMKKLKKEKACEK